MHSDGGFAENNSEKQLDPIIGSRSQKNIDEVCFYERHNCQPWRSHR